MTIHTEKIKDVTFKFRCPSKSEYETLTSLSGKNQYELYERIITACVIEPRITFDSTERENVVSLVNPPFILGDIEYIYSRILYKGGYTSEGLKECIQNATEYLVSSPGKYDTLSLVTIPGLSPQQLWDLEPDKLYKVYLMAEILAPVLGIPSKAIIHPEEYEKDLSAEARKRYDAEMQAKAAEAASAASSRGIRYQNEGTKTVKV